MISCSSSSDHRAYNRMVETKKGNKSAECEFVVTGVGQESWVDVMKLALQYKSIITFLVERLAL